MAGTAYYLSEQDVGELRDMLSWFRRTISKERVVPFTPTPILPQSPEVYLAKVPPSGIPALSQSGTAGTGTDQPLDDIPGETECEIYQLDTESSGSPSFERVGELTHQVYNIFPYAISADSTPWVMVVRDKFGSWHVASSPKEEFDLKIINVEAAEGYYPAILTNWDVDLDDYVDGADTVYVRALNGASLLTGSRYRGRPIGSVTISSVDYEGYEVIGDADFTTLSDSASTPTLETAWAGGLLSTSAQSIKGVKKFRDYLRVQAPACDSGFSGAQSFIQLLSSSTERAVVTLNDISAGFIQNMILTSDELGTSIVSSSLGSGWGISNAGTYFKSSMRFGPSNGANGSGTGTLAMNQNLILSRPSLGETSSTNLKYGVDRSNTTFYGIDLNLTVVTAVNFGASSVTTQDLLIRGGLIVEQVSAPPVPPPPPPPPAGTAIFRVHVWYDSNETGTGTFNEGELPVTGREVVAVGATTLIGTTDDSGYVDFEGVAPGSYIITVYLETDETCSNNRTSETAVADTTTEVSRPIVLTTVPPPPVAGLAVSIFKDGALASRAISWTGEEEGSSPAATVHFISNLPVGIYAVTVTPSGTDSGTWAWDVDNGTDTGAGVTTDSFTIVVNEKTPVRFDLTSTLYTISGTVTRSGSPEVGYTINLTGDSTDSDVTDGSGNYSFSVIAGTYNVAPSLTGGDSSAPPSITGITVGPSSSGNDFELTNVPPPP